MGQTVIGSCETDGPVKMNHDNDQSAGQGLPSSDKEGEENPHKPSMCEDGDIEMDAARVVNRF